MRPSPAYPIYSVPGDNGTSDGVRSVLTHCRAARPRTWSRRPSSRAVDGRDDIAELDAGLGCRAAFLRLVNHCAFGLLQAKAVGNARGHRLDLNAEPTAGDVAMVFQLGDDKLRRVGGDVEADAKLAKPTSPYVVGEQIRQIVEGDSWQLRYPIGPDAVPFLKWRAISAPAIVSRVLRRLGLNKLNALEPAEPVRRYRARKPG